jgi:glycosyltransferase involved in cell wall biosynthesis
MILKKIYNKVKSYVLKLEFYILKKWAFKFNCELKRIEVLTHDKMVINNYFNRNNKKSALLSYVIYPFLGSISNNHSNNLECFIMAEILDELGYNVDIINWDNHTFVPDLDYDLVVDNHNNLKRLENYFSKKTLKIFHATNAHWLYQNSIEYERYYDFFKKKGLAVTPPRLIQPGNSAENCDAISMFGNVFTKNTYGVFGQKVHHLPMSVTTKINSETNRNYTEAKKRFLWLNSHGALLKGLDIVLDTFILLPDFELYVCSDLKSDMEIISLLESQLSSAPNIKFFGWVDTDSEVYQTIVSECAFVISVSFSEGGGGSTLNCMASGLIPIVSRQTSLTVSADFGFYVNDNSVECLSTLIKNVSCFSNNILEGMSIQSIDFIEKNHSILNFKNKYKDFLSENIQSFQIIN